MTKQNLFIYLFLLFPFLGFSQELTEAEYFIDTDPGFGNGTAVAIPANNGATDLSFQADLTGVSNGVHLLYVRVKDENGKWSLTGYRPFYYNQAVGGAAPDLTEIEYFIDEDPGFGNGTPVSVGANSGAIAIDFDADLTGVSNGVHTLYVRARDATGSWSLTGYRPFYYNAASGQLRDITAMEYFWDDDPGFGSGIPIDFAQPGTVVVEDVDLDYSFLEPGEHTYYIRVRDDGGVWSLTATGTFEVPCLPPPIREVTNRTPTSARLNWTAKQSSEGFQIRGNRVGVAGFLNINAGAEDSTRFVGNLQLNRDYFWQIRSVCAVGDTSDWSVPDTFFTTCPQVQNLTTTDISINSATLNWDPIPGVNGYLIEGGLAGSSNVLTLNIGSGGVGQRTVNVLQPNRNYQWRIKAVCEDDAPFSAVASFSTPAAIPSLPESGESNYIVQVYPNPNSGSFFLDLPDLPERGRYEIYDVLGRMVKESRLTNYREEINLSETGVYNLFILDGDDIVETVKIVVQ
jgi:uncharacterized protein YceK